MALFQVDASETTVELVGFSVTSTIMSFSTGGVLDLTGTNGIPSSFDSYRLVTLLPSRP